jgi:Family of unknown function (DUF6232)
MAILEVSNRTIKFRNRILNLRTVTAIEKRHGRSRRPFSTKSLVYAVLFCLLAVLVMGAPYLRAPAFLTVLACVGYFTYAVARNREPRDFWLLRVETAAGSSNVLASRDERAIAEAVSTITAAMESDVDVHSTISIADSTLVMDSVIEHSSIENVGSKK